MSTNFKTNEIAVSHPAEELFNIAPGTTIAHEIVPVSDEFDTDSAEAIGYDAKDCEIDGQMQEIYNAALTTFHDQRTIVDSMPPEYRARTLEVAANFLSTALAAVTEKGKYRHQKIKLNNGGNHTINVRNTTNNNTVVMSRNDMLKEIKAMPDVADLEFEEAIRVDKNPSE